MRYYNITFASTYGSCSYGTAQYDNSDGTCTTGSSTGGSSSTGSSAGGLTNTGFDIILAATLACVIIFTSLVVRFLRRPAKPMANNEQS